MRSWIRFFFPASAKRMPDIVVVGLGNPGREYENTRHNVGFMVVDEIAKRLKVRFRKKLCCALVAMAEHCNRYLMLAKPLTFMNLSGEAVKCIVHHLSLPLDHLLIVLDDANLPLGKIRIRPSGSHGGHKGLKSVIDALGTEAISRLRVGIGAPKQGIDMVSFVLSPFDAHEEELIREAIARATEAVLACLVEGLEKAMSKFNV
ncbi:MAG: hypothetical protein RUDDFDWM_000297 [Candidatus Fervidibacterota bacterium]